MMPPASLLLAACLLLSPPWLACASNPDSEIFEDPKSSDQESKATERLQKSISQEERLQKSNGKATERLQMPNGQEGKATERLQKLQSAQQTDQRVPPSSFDLAIGPVRTGTFVTKEVLRQVLPDGFVTGGGRQSVAESPLPPSFGDRVVGRSGPVFGVRSSYGWRGYNRVSYGQATYQQSSGVNETVPVRTVVSNPWNNGPQRAPLNANREQHAQRIPADANRNNGPQRIPSEVNENNARTPDDSEQRPERIPNAAAGNNRQPFPGNGGPPSGMAAGGGTNNHRRPVVIPPRRPAYRPFLGANSRVHNTRNPGGNTGGFPRTQNPPRFVSTGGGGSADPNSRQRPVIPGGGGGTADPNSRQRPVSSGTADMNLYSGIINDFVFGLVDSLDLTTNFVVSPPSIFAALAMCYLGSGGSTRAQLERFLGLDASSVHGDRLHQGLRDLLATVQYQASMSGQRLSVANGLFLDRKYEVSPDFRSSLRNFYVAEVQNLDFADQDGSAAAINRWLSRATRNMITSMGSGPPSPLNSMMLLNAVYFRGTWKKQFPANMTYLGRFFTMDGKDKMVPTMPLYGETFPLHRDDALRHSFLKLPYRGDGLSMVLALPYTRADRPMPSSSDRALCGVRDALRDTQLDTVTLPKFRTEFEAPLRAPLTRLGVTDLFDAGKVDLSGMRPANDVVVSEVVSKAVVEVSERGTEAAATTGVRFVPLAYRNTTDFVVNHPFAFYVVHEPSGLVLFYGKVFDLGVDPASDNPSE